MEENKELELFLKSNGYKVAISSATHAVEVIKNEIGEYPILLLDDVLSELDEGRQNRLLNITTKYQTLISCTHLPTTDIKCTSIKIENGPVV